METTHLFTLVLGALSVLTLLSGITLGLSVARGRSSRRH